MLSLPGPSLSHHRGQWGFQLLCTRPQGTVGTLCWAPGGVAGTERLMCWCYCPRGRSGCLYPPRGRIGVSVPPSWMDRGVRTWARPRLPAPRLSQRVSISENPTGILTGTPFPITGSCRSLGATATRGQRYHVGRSEPL